MNAIIVFPLKAKKTRRVAEAIASGLQEKGATVENIALETLKKKNSEPEPKAAKTDLGGFDLLVFGSPVFGLTPKRKISKSVEAFIRGCQNIEGKKAAVFLTCFGIPGTALKKITGIVQARNAVVVDSIITAYLLGVSKKQLEDAKEFGKKIAGTV